jgi:hypothetical protein
MDILNRKKLWLLLVFIFLTFLKAPQKVFALTRIDLLTTDNFAVLGGSAISDTPTSVITGNVGLDPNGGASITGITCSEITGTLYDNNAGYAGGGSCRVTNGTLLTTAKNDLTTVYNLAAGETTTSTIATELGGSTLTGGVYNSVAGTFGITGTLTLDGQNDPNSVFVFKMASTLITASASNVVLINGAQPCNVYWQVGSSTTLGTGSTFVGNVLTLTSITDDGSSTVKGRLLARNGAVTLNKTTVIKQTCTAPTPTTSSTTSSSSTNSSGGGSNSNYIWCPPLDNTIGSPIVISSKRMSPISISLTWGPYSGINKFNIQYGFENGNWLYNFDTTEFSTTINDLKVNQPIWVRIANRDDCRIGNYGEAKLVGGPGLPNTGSISHKNNFKWYVSVVLIAIISIITILIQRKNRFLSRH